MLKTISFEEIVEGRNATIRVTDGCLLSAVDLVMVVTGKNSNDANKTLRELKHKLFSNDNHLKRGRSRVVTFTEAIELIMVLPDDTTNRVKFVEILRRYMPDDSYQVKKRKLESRTVTLQERTVELWEKELSYIKNSVDLLQSITGRKLDDHTILQYEDLIRNLLSRVQLSLVDSCF